MDFVLPQEYKWLLNFCGFYKGEAEDPFEKRFKQLVDSGSELLSGERIARLQTASSFWFYEERWVMFTINRECGHSYCRHYLRDGLEDFLKDNGTPMTLKALLHNRYMHWGGDYEHIDAFRNWYIEQYDKLRDTRDYNSLSKGQKILNEYRLEKLMYEADKEEMELTDEMAYRFKLVDAVDSRVGYNCPVDEAILCKALEHAQEHGLTIEIVPSQSCEDRCDGWEYIADFKEVRAKALRYLKDNEEFDYDGNRYDTVYFCGIWEDKYVYSLSASSFDPETPPAIIGLPEALIVDGDNAYIRANLIEIMQEIENLV